MLFYMTKRQLRLLASLIITLGFLVVIALHKDGSPPLQLQEGEDSAQHQDTNPRPIQSTAIATNTNAFVVRTVDGDTLTARLDAEPDTEVKVRLLGINTPEIVDPRRPVECFGKQASDFLKDLVAGDRIELIADPEADEIDKYGRLLRNVYLADGTDINALMVAQGYAYAYVSFPQNEERKAELRRLETEAREAKLGLWNPETCLQAE